MANPITQSNTDIRVLTTAPSADVTSLSTFDTAYPDSTIVAQVDNVGDAAQNANNQDIPLWGGTTISTSLPPTFTPFSFSYIFDTDVALHASLYARAIGSSIWVGLKSTGLGGTNDEAALEVVGTISSKSINNTADGRRVNLEVAITSVNIYSG